MGDLMRAVLGKVLTLVGSDGTHFYSAYIDSNGHLRVNIAASSMPGGIARETTLEEIMDRIGARNDTVDGSLNYKLAQLLTALTVKNASVYKSQYTFSGETTGSSGNLTVDSTAVAEGQLAEIQACTAWLSAGSATVLQISLKTSGGVFPLLRQASPAVDNSQTVYGPFTLKQGDFIRATAVSVGASTTVKLAVVGKNYAAS